MNLVGHLTELRHRPKPFAVDPALRRAQQTYEIGAECSPGAEGLRPTL